MLALLDVELTQVVRAIREYEKLTRSFYRNLPADLRKEAEAAQSHLLCLFMAVVGQSFTEVQARENRFLQDLLHVGGAATDEGVLDQEFLSAAMRHCGADEGVLIGRSATQLAIRCDGTKKGTIAPRKPSALAQLARVRQMKPDAQSVLIREWTQRPGTVWSIPIGENVLQLRFAGERPLLPRELKLMQQLARSWSLASQRLQREQRLHGVSLRMLEVEELERKRVSRELHDDAGQSLVVIRLQMEMVELNFPDARPEMTQQLSEIRELTEKTILNVRKLISVLSPAVLEQLGLAAALRQLVNRFRQAYPSRVKLHIGKIPNVHPLLEMVIYRVLQECFANIALHSKAGSVNVSLTSIRQNMRLIVEDDGEGFNVEEGLSRRNCFGLIGIRSRVRLLNGRFSVESRIPQKDGSERGTRVLIELPITDENLREVVRK